MLYISMNSYEHMVLSVPVSMRFGVWADSDIFIGIDSTIYIDFFESVERASAQAALFLEYLIF